ncbi:glycoside hydrolase family 65 protein [Alkalibacillus haloalkaliphilus]|uniref:glycoside hydrolase family 65 protein n=1 Tax=Alkalibacillus haloalkaliphilus TaxID=94136 RepID=UPI0003158C1C|nr:glycosyl hydrolase family 65 protein [Alkalibacillus haloalkaliphilus]
MIRYDVGQGEFKDWVVAESGFSPNHLRKFEAVMALGNGYMGLRSAMEESYFGEKRNLFVNGTFNQADPTEVTELPNLADVTQIDFYIDGERFHLEIGETDEYVRLLNLKTAELTRSFKWTSPKGKTFQFQCRRFVSLAERHLIGMKVEVEALNESASVQLVSAINGQTTNTGAQHFLNGVPRIYGDDLLEYVQTTRQSNVDIALVSQHRLSKEAKVDKLMDRRKVGVGYQFDLAPDEKVTLEKLTTVYTSRDREFLPNGADQETVKQQAHDTLEKVTQKNYDELRDEHRQAWFDQIWNRYNIEINSQDHFDQLAVRFSIYHMTIMTPDHDSRMGIGAKGLSGEGYKGHSFWDTEIFVLPFFTYSNPEVARSLLTYRYYGLESARAKAEENGYEGAMYPWEMAFPDDGEVTPLYGDIDIITGERSKIWTGLIEQHITADIAFAVNQYYNVTNDEAFLNDYGYEMVFDSANFWASRYEWNEAEARYEIHNVIGPDEYKEHVNNNAYTNYMSYFNLKLAIKYYEFLIAQNENVFATLDEKLALQQNYENWKEKAEKIFLPAPREEDQVIQQDDTYLSLPEIDLDKYKKQEQPRTIYKDYNQPQINKLQVTKQADVLVLLYLLEQTFLKDEIEFDAALKRANFNYYEPRTLHDSSLSLSTHAIVASDFEKMDMAYHMFRRAAEIDLGQNMKSSQEGIHAASIAGIWSIAVFGFAGVRLTPGGLSINPTLPKQWNSMTFNIDWQGEQLRFEIDQDNCKISKDSMTELPITIQNQVLKLKDTLTVPLAFQYN